MKRQISRMDFLKLVGLGGVVFASGLPGVLSAAEEGTESSTGDFFFVQLSDTHWGFSGPKVNPEAENTLREAVAAVNALATPPDFVVFTGDLTHTTDDEAERRRRLSTFKEIVAGLKVKSVRFMPGEHDASLDAGKAYSEFFGRTHYTFEHKGVHFIALDNVSDPHGMLGDAQLKWLAQDLARQKKAQPIVVLTHRPLFALYPQWDWDTKDGQRAIELLLPFPNVTVFYGHIHQEHHHKTEHIAHHAARSLMFPLPAPGSVPKKAPLPWNPAAPFAGLGFRDVQAEVYPARLELTLQEKGVKA